MLHAPIKKHQQNHVAFKRSYCVQCTFSGMKFPAKSMRPVFQGKAGITGSNCGMQGIYHVPGILDGRAARLFALKNPAIGR